MDSKETIGYICRWCLLTMSAVVALVSSVAVVRATAGVSEGVNGSIVVSDALWAGGAELDLRLYGYIDPSPFEWEAPYVLVRGAGYHISLVRLEMQGIHLRLPGPVMGRSRIVVVPIPYSREAFDRWSVQLVKVAENETIYMIDARMAVLDDPTPSPDMLNLLTDLRRRGLVMFIGAGAGEGFAALRRRVDRLDPEAILVCTRRRGELTVVPDEYLARTGLTDRGRLVVITDSPESARRLIGKEIRTHLIGLSDSDRIAPSDYLTRHDGIAGLRDHLDWHPTD